MVQVKDLQLCTLDPTHRVEGLLVDAGLLYGRCRELLLHIASTAMQVGDMLSWHGTHTQLADALECHPRTVRRCVRDIKAMKLSWLELTQPIGRGAAWIIYLQKVGQTPDRPRTDLGQTPDRPRTDLGQTPDRPRTKVGQNQGGMGAATHTGVTIPPSEDTTYPPQEEKKTRACTASPSPPTPSSAGGTFDDLIEFLTSTIRESGVVTPMPTGFALERIAMKVLSRTESQGEREAFILDRLVDLTARKQSGKKVDHSALHCALVTHADFVEWKQRQTAKPAPRTSGRVSTQAPQRQLTNTVAPMTTTEQMSKMISYGSRNLDKLKPTDDDRARQARAKSEQEAEQRRRHRLQAIWTSLHRNRIVDIYEYRRTNTWEGIETRLRELGRHPDQQSGGVS